jgi:hypothetical protein
MIPELTEAVLKKAEVLDVNDLKYTKYENGSLYFLGTDKAEGSKTLIRLNLLHLGIYQTWETHRDIEFHVGDLI